MRTREAHCARVVQRLVSGTAHLTAHEVERGQQRATKLRMEMEYRNDKC